MVNYWLFYIRTTDTSGIFEGIFQLPDDPELKELPNATNVLSLPNSELVITTHFVPLLWRISIACKI